MTIDALATRRHYLDHLLPVWEALPAEHRGTLYVGGLLIGAHPEAVPQNANLYRPGPRVLVAGQIDYQSVVTFRRAIWSHHGAGQSYGADPDPAVNRASSYAGGDNQGKTDLFLVPGPHPAERTRQRYPHIPVVEVGCPALDRWLNRERAPNIRPVVALAWHGDSPLCTETWTALPHFRSALPDLARTYTVLGHSHPRGRNLLAPVYEEAGITSVGYETVMDLADVLIVDNSSIGWEFAATGWPVVWLTPPWYRNLNHGVRFGGDIGAEVRDPADLLGAVDDALAGRAPTPDLSRVYSHLDGRSAERAAAAIVALEEGRDPETATRLEVLA
ncbi:MAG: hypothetical protein ABR532_08950 [Candidatus Dormibacteria bacterium]